MKNVLVVGTGTIGEPLIGLLAQHKEALGIDNVYFFKRTPLSDEKGKVEALIRKGSKLVSTSDALDEFKNLGFEPENVENSYEDCQVIIDCTPSGKSFKVKGEGISPQGRRSGDLYVRVSIKPPSKLSKSGKKKLEEFRDEGYEGAPEEYRGYLYE